MPVCVVLFVFAAFNYVMYLNTDGCRQLADCGYKVGFPFTVFAHGTISHVDNISWPGVLADVAVALIAGLAVGSAAASAEHRYK
jgi:hypothetical protein